MIKKIKFNIFLILYIFFLVINLVANDHIEITAKKVEYQNETKLILASGKVLIKNATVQIMCDEIIYDTENNKIQAKGNIKYSDGIQVITSKEANFMFDEKKGSLYSANSKFSEWYSGGKIIEKTGENEYQIKKGFVSTCDYEKPHYKLYSKKMKIYPKDHLEAFNVFLIIGKVPVFYFPYYWQPLKKLRFDFEFQAGYNTNDGNYIKSAFGYQLSRYLYFKYYLDYFELNGTGQGIKLEIDNKKNFKNTIYSYYIKEEKTERERWTANISQVHSVTDSLSYSVNYNYQSDETITDKYKYNITPGLLTLSGGGSWLEQRISRNIVTNLYLRYNKKKYSLNLLMEKNDTWNELKSKYETFSAIIPSINFSTVGLKFKKIPFNYLLNIDFSNNYTRDISTTTENYQNTLNSSVSIFDSFRIIKSYLTYSPRIYFYSKIIRNKNSISDKYIDTSYLQYSANNSIRLNLFRDWSISINHSYAQNFDNLDKISYNQLNLDTRLTLFKKLQVFFSSDYDINLITNKELKRYSPLFGEIRFKNKTYDTYIRSRYYFYEDYISEINSGFYKYFKNGYLNFSLGYINNDPEKHPTDLDFVYKIGYKLTKKWYLSVAERLLVNNQIPSKSLNIEREISLYRDLHCWEGKITYRSRSDIKELWIMVNIKAFPTQKIGVYNESQKGTWYFRGQD